MPGVAAAGISLGRLLLGVAHGRPHPTAFHRRAGRPRRHRRGDRQPRAAQERAGREYKACCPFHDEKTPSFTVEPGQAVLSLLRLRRARHGARLPDGARPPRLRRGRGGARRARRARGAARRRRRGARRAAERRAVRRCSSGRRSSSGSRSAANRARARTTSRRAASTGDSAAALRHRLRAATPGTALLERYGTSRGRAADAAAAPASSSSASASHGANRGYYDRFRDRVMFPIRDARGRTIAFGGRVLDKGEPKYLNSPETELFHKGRELYGLYEARQATRNLDAAARGRGLHGRRAPAQAGITYAVATLGTATTPEHLQRIFRLVRRGGVLLRRRPRRPRRRLARAGERAQRGASRAASCASCSCPTATIRTRWWARKAREAFEARHRRSRSAVRIPDRRAGVARRHGERRWPGAGSVELAPSADPAHSVRTSIASC